MPLGSHSTAGGRRSGISRRKAPSFSDQDEAFARAQIQTSAHGARAGLTKLGLELSVPGVSAVDVDEVAYANQRESGGG